MVLIQLWAEPPPLSHVQAHFSAQPETERPLLTGHYFVCHRSRWPECFCGVWQTFTRGGAINLRGSVESAADVTDETEFQSACSKRRRRRRPVGIVDRAGTHVNDGKTAQKWILHNMMSGTENLQRLVKSVKTCFPVSPPRVLILTFPLRTLCMFFLCVRCVAQKPSARKIISLLCTFSSTHSPPSAAVPPLKADWSRATLRRCRAPDWLPRRQKRVCELNGRRIHSKVNSLSRTHAYSPADLFYNQPSVCMFNFWHPLSRFFFHPSILVATQRLFLLS